MTNSLNKDAYSLWRLMRAVGGKAYLVPCLRWALAVGFSFGLLLAWLGSCVQRSAMVGDMLITSSVLLGAVFASLSLVVGQMSDSYLEAMDYEPQRVINFLAPFVAGIVIQVVAMSFAVLYRAAAPIIPIVEPYLFVLVSVAFMYAFIDVVAMTPKVIAHAATRAFVLGNRSGKGGHTP